MTAPSPAPGLPLDGITVVSLEQAVAAPYATRQLADLGARVIKVERPGGGDFARTYDSSVKGLASYFVWLNRGKESVALDLKSAAGLSALTALIGRADVFVQNLAPGAADRMGLSAAALRARDQKLIVCDVSGYAPDGPMGDRRAYDLLIQCETGLLSVTGSADAPAKAGISVADIAGGMFAFSSILAALYARATTGDGAALSVSLFESLTEWMSQPMYYAMYTGTPPPRTGTSHATIAPYGTFRTGGGRLGAARGAERPGMAAAVRPGARPSRAGRRPPVRDQPGAGGQSRRAARGDRGRAGRLPGGEGARAARRRADRQRPDEHRRRPARPPAACAPLGARWTPRPARCARCRRRSASAAPRPRSARSRPWASTRPPCWRSSGWPTPLLPTTGHRRARRPRRGRDAVMSAVTGGRNHATVRDNEFNLLISEERF